MMQRIHKRRGLLPGRHSIVWKLFGTFLLCIVLLLAILWLLNSFVLERYYRAEKTAAIEDAFRRVNGLCTDDFQTDAARLDTTLESMANLEGVFSTIWIGSYYFSYTPQGSQPVRPSLPAKRFSAGEYEVQLVRDTRLENHYFITLTGQLHNGVTIQMRAPVAAIEESVGVTNRFLLLSGAAALAVALVLCFLIARNFTRPIEELSRVAKSVARLDFRDRYTRGGKNELADLGQSINAMSAALENAISDLKTANLQLTSDIQQKTRQNEAHRAFIANVSHELKTPIALIGAYAEGLKEDIAEGAASRDYYCEVIVDEAQKMSALIQRMTMLMQLEAGGGDPLVIERMDIASLCTALLDKMQISFAQRHVTLAYPGTEPVYVWADGYLIEHVLTNYLSNALHHVNEGGRVEIRILPKEEERVRVSVFNTGSHIAPEDLPLIWESFYKADKARTREYGGSGIGLSVVAAVMKAHGMPYGVYNCHGAQEDGVEFYIELDAR